LAASTGVPVSIKHYGKPAMYDQMMPGVNGAILDRIKFIDEYLLDCIKKGLKQLVIIGAGYDTRGYRFTEVKDNLKVFEAATDLFLRCSTLCRRRFHPWKYPTGTYLNACLNP
jgi:hypothetical protein